MNKSSEFSPEFRERAVRMVQEHRGECRSLLGDGGIDYCCSPRILPMMSVEAPIVSFGHGTRLRCDSANMFEIGDANEFVAVAN
jgi:hypothetical protein